jgi:hypothetical protein
MPRLSLGLGVQNIRKVGGGAAPSGIPVASTGSVVIGNAGAFNNGTYARIGTGANPLVDWILTGYVYRKPDSYFTDEGRILFSPNSTISDANPFDYLGTPFSSWTLVYLSYDVGEDTWNTSIVATNASTDANYIPTTGWTPAITITAA